MRQIWPTCPAGGVGEEADAAVLDPAEGLAFYRPAGLID